MNRTTEGAAVDAIVCFAVNAADHAADPAHVPGATNCVSYNPVQVVKCSGFTLWWLPTVPVGNDYRCVFY